MSVDDIWSMYRVLFGITGIIVGTCLGFLVSWLGPELLRGLHLVIGSTVSALIGCALGEKLGNAIGAKIENTLGERAILLFFWMVFIVVMCCLIWLISEWA